MATLTQRWEAERGTIDETVDRGYLVVGCEDEAALRTYALANVPADIGGYYYLRKIEVVERVGDDAWEILARYEKPSWTWAGGSPPDSRFAFDIGGGIQHITQSLETVASYGPKASALNNGAIGFDGKTVQGVDVVVPVHQFSETHYFADDDIDEAYKLAVEALVGHTNDAAFRGRAIGEVLFLGAPGSRPGDDANDLWEITFRFAASKNKVGLQVGDIAGIAKKGWEYLDIRYADVEDDATEQVLKEPVAVYVHRVYDSGDFSSLEIG